MTIHRWTPPDFSDLDALTAALDRACPAAAPVRQLRILTEPSDLPDRSIPD